MWEAYFFQVVSGTIGPKVNFKDLSWSISANDIGEFKVSLSKTDLPDIRQNPWLNEWWSGIVVMYAGNPIVAGPIISRPSESFTEIKLDCKDIRSVFEHRLAINEQDDWAKLAANKVKYSGMSLGTIRKNVVQLGMNKPGGPLPISFPIADQDAPADGEHQRTYEGYNLSNINVDAILTKLSGVVNGPDFQFKPRLTSDNKLTFDMLYGTEAYPYLQQDFVPVWDTTSTYGDVTDLDIVRTGTYMLNRAFVTGDGKNEATKIKEAHDFRFLERGYPLLEGVRSFGEIKTSEVLQGHATGYLNSNKNPMMEIQLTVRADGNYPLGTFWPGWECQLHIKNWLDLKDGAYWMRILTISGSNANSVRMSLQLSRT